MSDTTMSEFEGHTLVESYDDGWCWSVPLSEVERFVAVMADPQRTELAEERGIPGPAARAAGPFSAGCRPESAPLEMCSRLRLATYGGLFGPSGPEFADRGQNPSQGPLDTGSPPPYLPADSRRLLALSGV